INISKLIQMGIYYSELFQLLYKQLAKVFLFLSRGDSQRIWIRLSVYFDILGKKISNFKFCDCIDHGHILIILSKINVICKLSIQMEPVLLINFFGVYRQIL